MYQMIPYLIFDTETDDTHSCNKNVNPLDPMSSIRLIQYKSPDSEAEVIDIGVRDLHYDSKVKCALIELLGNTRLLVGHNIKYDLSFLWKYNWFQKWLKDGGKIFDTAQAEYLISGQSKTYPDLDYCSAKYGGNPKQDWIKPLFKEGKTSTDIMNMSSEKHDLFIEYAKDDVINTEIVYLAQMKYIVTKTNMLPMMEAYMEHLLATLEMEYNGLSIKYGNLKKLQERHAKWTERLKIVAKQELQKHLPACIEANPGSKDHLSWAFFGGTCKIKTREVERDINGEPIRYGKSAQKAGQIKYKNITKELKIKGFDIPIEEKWKTKKKGIYSTDKKILRKIQDKSNLDCKNLINKVLRYAKNTKIQSTYLDGYIKFNSYWDNCIRPNFNTVSTVTGRLSCSTPNFQNTHPKVLRYFTPRKENWVMAEIDFSQLEVVMQAYLTQDYVLMSDLINGMDFHCLRLSYIVDKSYTEVKYLCDTDPKWAKERKKAKAISFAKAYGAGAKTISENTGIDIEIVKKVLTSEDNQYEGVVQYYKDLAQSIMTYRRPTNIPADIAQFDVLGNKTSFTKEGEFAAYYLLNMPYGTTYVIPEWVNMNNYGKINRSPSMTTLKNYPVQGLAALLVSMQVGRLFRWCLHNRDKCIIINEVHDSVLMEIDRNHLDFVLNHAKLILEDTSAWERRFNMKWNVPLKVDTKYGANWAECK